ncbi:nicotinate (nicotinamide) nucleotide adenylyltransferase [Spirochaeta isovalerica]|uniref:Probable nicotinate-nucleotide adenylyltransferase n=1 Tax=Spirochaeta isovalerica TaxID=150 RepID=A0A841R7L4_9SPIO|nr:nicotinate (nicotinamide) nucleotide adenylyltransferase [Spirochaeta isovalerica]MBB6479030.1 nicotinate-nucleotide adenylyltransferase [Spirochaeta isovalerica]
MKLTMLGGTFNPLHLGHINLAEIVREEFAYDRILFVPSFLPAHKDITGNVSADERLEMIRLSLRPYDWADYSDCEIRRKGVSYTVDTLEYIYSHYEFEGKPGLIIGDDLAENFYKWRSTERIFELADLIIAHRLYKHEISLTFPHRYADNRIFSLSSSQIRDLAQSGQDLSDLVPPEALRYIRENRLYG